MAKSRIICLLILSVFIFCKSSEETLLSDFQKIHSDISFGYFGGKDKLFLVHSGCTESKNELLVFLHGSPGSWRDYKRYLLSNSLRFRYCIVVFDRPGYGNSFPDRSFADLKIQAYLLQSSLDDFLVRGKKKFNHIVYVGHSYGGPIAASIVSENDRDGINLVLISASMDPNLEEVRWYNYLATFAIIQFILPKELIHSNEEMFPLKAQLQNLSERFAIKKSRILVIHGRDDFLVDYENVNYMKKRTQNHLFNSIELTKENHFIPWTRFDLVENSIMELKE